MRRRFLLPCLVLLLGIVAGSAGAQELPPPERQTGASGLPLPRFVSLGAPRANLRSGPGREYPVRWVYVRRHWPLKVVQEYGVWRKVEDIDGTTGWMHAALLSGRRTGVIRGPGPVPLTARPRADAPVARPGCARRSCGACCPRRSSIDADG